jgi:hypothetical protein
MVFPIYQVFFHSNNLPHGKFIGFLEGRASCIFKERPLKDPPPVGPTLFATHLLAAQFLVYIVYFH